MKKISLKIGLLVSTFALSSLFASSLFAEQANNTELTLEQVMADPDWIGNAPQSAYISDDGKSVFYYQKRKGSRDRDLWKLDLATNQSVKVPLKDLFTVDNGYGVLSPDGHLKAFNNRGDLWIKYLSSGELRQLTRTNRNEGRPQFIGNAKVAFRQGYSFYSLDLNSGMISEIASVAFTDDPRQEESKNALEKQQSRYFDYIKKRQEQRKLTQEISKKIDDSSDLDAAGTWYFGKNKTLATFSLSPNGRYLLVGVLPKSSPGKSDNMPHFVTEDGYVKNEKVRALVGTRQARNETLYMLDLFDGSKTKVDFSSLPEIDKDPLASIKKATAKRTGKKFKPHKGNRDLAVFTWNPNRGVSWTNNGSKVAVMLFSDDNKDRWIVEIDGKGKSKTLHHLQDEAWINDWDFNYFGWLNDNETLYFTGEDTGYSHLYLTSGSKPKAITKGRFIVNNVNKTNDGRYLYFNANKKHPGIYEVYRYDTASKNVEAITNLGGMNGYKLSDDGSSMVVSHSNALNPTELYFLDLNQQSVSPRKLTDSTSNRFKSIDWAAPEFVQIPSREADLPIHARLYKPKNFDNQGAEKYPAVIFIHGAGYLQNAHQGWSRYFREFMFHTFLTQQGYVVLDLDYRASKGYGRDWRTAIYRQMGTPEVVDLKDSADWMAKNTHVDREKIGIYGGSYGGFLTFMALFTEPDAFAAGASLRPVTDWVHYNHGYTSNILNTPAIDPEAFEKSSPIEYAEGLNKPLLIAHGMVDDNVFFKDTVRLVQRLIELEKTEYFETAIYPIEPHGFTEPSSWLDEYKRIYYLFEKHLK